MAYVIVAPSVVAAGLILTELASGRRLEYGEMFGVLASAVLFGSLSTVPSAVGLTAAVLLIARYKSGVWSRRRWATSGFLAGGVMAAVVFLSLNMVISRDPWLYVVEPLIPSLWVAAIPGGLMGCLVGAMSWQALERVRR